MATVLVTGATGTVGASVLAHLHSTESTAVFRSTRTTTGLQPDELYFDFDDLPGMRETLRRVDTLFLLRPPHISDVGTSIAPVVRACVEENVQHIVFLSVQGADRVSFIPHAKIEKLIVESGLAYTFVRPSYFMQNLTTTLREDIARRDRIALPAGNAKFLWIDVGDIGRAVARILLEPERHRDTSYTLTGSQLATFGEVAALLSTVLGRTIAYVDMNPLSFLFRRVRSGTPLPFALVMLALHYLPRFQREPEISADIVRLTGEEPATLEQFTAAHRREWERPGT